MEKITLINYGKSTGCPEGNQETGKINKGKASRKESKEGRKITPELLSSRNPKVTTQDPPAITKPEVSPDVVTSIDPSTLDDSFVYLHCHFSSPHEDLLIRIWRTSCLIDRESESRSSLVHAENISLAPIWTQVRATPAYSFLLIFSSLPKSCLQFDFKEEIAQAGGFYVPNIQRNETDVYHVDIM